MKNILIVAAHPDDEILGVGGTVSKHVALGDKAYALILGEGQTSRGYCREDTSSVVVEELQRKSELSSGIIGYTDVFFENLPDNRFDQIDLLDIVKIVEKIIQKIKPETIYTHFSGDLNIDHQLTARAVLTATRPVNNCCVKEIFAFETLSSTEWNFDYSGHSIFTPNVFVDISNQFELKEKALQCYSSEICQFPHPRSITGMKVLAMKRGSEIGFEKAEAFMLIRKIEE